MSGPDAAPAGRPRPFVRDLLVLAGFVLLTAAMTWPWAARLRTATMDPGDSYLNAWILWWGYHQTFTDPFNLFQANIYYPYRYTLAFSEHNYGIALPLFPLFALGVTPLAAHGVAMLTAFALSGFGAFRLTRTLTGSAAAGWVAGVSFAFAIYRFHQIFHLNYAYAGWMALLLEALVLFVRQRSWKRAAWLGAAFAMNGLVCIHWMILSAIPLAVTGIALGLKNGALKDRELWRRGGLALGAAALVLVPFLVPYQKVAKLYKLERNPAEAMEFSAKPQAWLNADPRSKVWIGFGENPSPGELCLFPGALALLLPLAALFLARPAGEAPAESEAGASPAPRTALLAFLDGVSALALLVGTLASGISPFEVKLGERVLLKASDGTRAFGLLAVLLLVRWSIRWPAAFRWVRSRNLRESVRRSRCPDALAAGAIWALLGFLGSFGLRFPFHRFLFEHVFVFRSIRVPARWAMVADLGLAVLSGLGALLLAEAAARRLPGAIPWRRVVPAVAVAALLLELRAAPLSELMDGEARPDEVSLFLAKQPMRGGLVELPTGGMPNYRYVLRAADHGKPLVNGVSGFGTPTADRLEQLTRQDPFPEELWGFLESIPASYVVVHQGLLDEKQRAQFQQGLSDALARGRLRFVRSFAAQGGRDDLFAVAKTEPDVQPLAPLPWAVSAAKGPEDPGLLGGFDEPAEGATVRRSLVVRGWARIPGEDLAVRVLVGGEERPPAATRRFARPDVAAAFPALGDCSSAGFEVTVPLVPGDRGPRSVQVVLVARDGRQRHYDGRQLTLAD